MSGITLKQLSELSGLSVRTVNRVLKGEAHVVPQKRDLVLELARKYNYIPNMAARNLRLSRTNVVGIICADMMQEVSIKKLHDLMIRLESCGYYPLIGQLDSSLDKISCMLAEWSGMMKHLVVMSSVTEDLSGGVVDLLRQYPLNVIFIDQKGVDGCHTLNINRATGIRCAITHFIRSGRRKILRCGNIGTRDSGLAAAFEEIALSERPEFMRIRSRPEFENGLALGDEIMRTGADAVFFDTDRMALGFMNYAAAHHIPIPERIAVVGFDDDSSGRMVYPALSTVAHPVASLNEAILSIIRSDPEKPVVKTFDTEFIRRGSA